MTTSRDKVSDTEVEKILEVPVTIVQPGVNLTFDTQLDLTTFIDRLAQIPALEEPVQRYRDRQGSYQLILDTYAYNRDLGQRLVVTIIEEHLEYWGYIEDDQKEILQQVANYVLEEQGISEERYNQVRAAFDNEQGSYSNQDDLFLAMSAVGPPPQLTRNTGTVLDDIFDFDDPDLGRQERQCLARFRELVKSNLDAVRDSPYALFDNNGELVAINNGTILAILLNRFDRNNETERFCLARLLSNYLLEQLDLNLIGVGALSQEELDNAFFDALVNFAGEANGLEQLVFREPDGDQVTFTTPANDSVADVFEQVVTQRFGKSNVISPEQIRRPGSQ